MTLMEALVVVAITALVSGIGFARLRADSEGAAWRNDVAALTAAVRSTRAEAIRTGQPAAIDIAPGGRAFGMRGAAATELMGDGRIDGDPTIRFFGDGSSSGGAVTLSEGAHRTTVTVDMATGVIGLAAGEGRP